MLQNIKLEILGQAETDTEEFKEQWFTFAREMQRYLAIEFTALKPLYPRLFIEMNITTEDVVNESSQKIEHP